MWMGSCRAVVLSDWWQIRQRRKVAWGVMCGRVVCRHMGRRKNLRRFHARCSVSARIRTRRRGLCWRRPRGYPFIENPAGSQKMRENG
jgi:hypothetical protein